MSGAGGDDGQPEWVLSFGVVLVVAIALIVVGCLAFVLFLWSLPPLGPGDDL